MELRLLEVNALLDVPGAESSALRLDIYKEGVINGTYNVQNYRVSTPHQSPIANQTALQ